MISGVRRGITRGEAALLVGGVTLLAVAVVVAAWGAMSWWGHATPVQTPGVPVLVAPAIFFVAVVGLVGVLWQQTLRMLRGGASLVWWPVVACAAIPYCVWCVVGVCAGMAVSDTWLSGFVAVFAAVWAVAVVLHWAVLVWRLFTDSVRVSWPWEGAPADE